MHPKGATSQIWLHLLRKTCVPAVHEKMHFKAPLQEHIVLSCNEPWQHIGLCATEAYSDNHIMCMKNQMTKPFFNLYLHHAMHTTVMAYNL